MVQQHCLIFIHDNTKGIKKTTKNVEKKKTEKSQTLLVFSIWFFIRKLKALMFPVSFLVKIRQIQRRCDFPCTHTMAADQVSSFLSTHTWLFWSQIACSHSPKSSVEKKGTEKSFITSQIFHKTVQLAKENWIPLLSNTLLPPCFSYSFLQDDVLAGA